jgi:hypothetical protein
MGLGGKMTDGVNPILVEEIPDDRRIANVRLPEYVASRPGLPDTVEIFRISRIGKAVYIDDPPPEIRFREQMADEITTDKTTPPGNQQIFTIHESPFFLDRA